jgi:5-methyltetrahydropteroyltriglutamate--homocysteine methyltransferase
LVTSWRRSIQRSWINNASALRSGAGPIELTDLPAVLLTTIAGSLPKPAWLAEQEKLWAPWRLPTEQLGEGQRDAVLVALKEQETAGIEIVSDGEQSRQHFVHGFLERIEGIDFTRPVRIGIRADRYTAEVPVVRAPVRRPLPIHLDEVRWARMHTARPLKFTIPGPMTVVDTVADEYYRDRPRLALEIARIINDEARELAEAGLDVLQLDEPAFNVYPDDVADWGIEALHQAIEGLTCTTAVHICYGYGIPANIAWKRSLGDEWRQYERIFPLLTTSGIDQVSVECAGSRVPMSLLGLLPDKDVQVGCIDVATERLETPEDVAEVIEAALQFVPPERLFPSTNCGMAPMPRKLARNKLRALSAGAELVRVRYGRS